MAYNPFDDINTQLTEIRQLIEARKAETEKSKVDPLDQYIPIKKVIGRYVSRTTFYSHVKDGAITLYKFGSLSFVKADEFFGAFDAMNVSSKDQFANK